jgi:hypothetical protein
MRRQFASRGPILWVGMRNNLPPLLEWLSEHPLDLPLHILTNLDTPESPTASELGFSDSLSVTIERWTAERHRALCRTARGAIDLKGDDFRQRHKPAAKAIDFIASGLPLAMNPDSSSSRYVRELGFDIAAPEDTSRWLSKEYWQETRRFGKAIGEILSLKRVSLRFEQILQRVWKESQ